MWRLICCLPYVPNVVQDFLYNPKRKLDNNLNATSLTREVMLGEKIRIKKFSNCCENRHLKRLNIFTFVARCLTFN